MLSGKQVPSEEKAKVLKRGGGVKTIYVESRWGENFDRHPSVISSIHQSTYLSTNQTTYVPLAGREKGENTTHPFILRYALRKFTEWLTNSVLVF